MDLYIQIDENGKAVNHPMLEDNLRQAFPGIDTNNLPSHIAKFQRTLEPDRKPYEKEPRVTYEPRGGVYTEVYHREYMTSDEAIEAQNQVKADFAANPNSFKSWIFNEDTCKYQPPIPLPLDGKRYRWDEPKICWVELKA
jgi:hypothetical protein